jgi:tRNA G37 N-methylase TrmD
MEEERKSRPGSYLPVLHLLLCCLQYEFFDSLDIEKQSRSVDDVRTFVLLFVGSLVTLLISNTIARISPNVHNAYIYPRIGDSGFAL